MNSITEVPTSSLASRFGDQLLKNELPLSVFVELFLSRERPGLSPAEQERTVTEIYECMAEDLAAKLSQGISCEWDSLEKGDLLWAQEAGLYYHWSREAAHKLKKLLEQIDDEECDNDGQPVGNHRQLFTTAARKAALALRRDMTERPATDLLQATDEAEIPSGSVAMNMMPTFTAQ